MTKTRQMIALPLGQKVPQRSGPSAAEIEPAPVGTPRSPEAVGEVRDSGLLARVLRWRDALLANPAVQNLTVALPFLRPVANRRARQLFDLCIGFVHTQVITACVAVDLFEKLATEPLSPARLAAETGLDVDAATRLLRAAAAIKLVRCQRDGRYRLGELGAAFRGAPGLTEIVRHNQIFYRDFRDPEALLRGTMGPTELSQFWPYAEGAQGVRSLTREEIEPYTRFMAATQPFIADDVLAAHDFRRHRALLDVGGGNGAFASAVARANSSLRVGVFDLPAVVEAAQETFSRQQLAERASVHGGDFHRDPMPQGYDAISFVRVLLDHDDDRVVALLGRARAALPAGGTVLVAELMSEAAGAETISDAYFAFYLLAMGRGRPRSVARISKLLEAAGFVSVAPVKTRRMLMTQLIVGSVPKG